MPDDLEVCERGVDERDGDIACCNCKCACARGEVERLSTAICCPCHEPD